MKRSVAAFTLIELLIAIFIIGVLITLVAPQIQGVRERAQSAKCANNLRQIGVAVISYATDHDNRFPAVESMPGDEVYDSSVGGGEPPKPIYETLSPYGVTKAVLQCPNDLQRSNYFAKKGSSYGWRNVVDQEVLGNVKIYTRRGIRNPNASWLLLATDYEPVHSGHANRLYADGHVKAF